MRKGSGGPKTPEKSEAKGKGPRRDRSGLLQGQYRKRSTVYVERLRTPDTPALIDLDPVGTPGSGVQVNHRKLKFICFGCGQEYPGLRDFLDCVEEHAGVEI